MRCFIRGEVVDVEQDAFNGNPFFAAFVQLGSVRDGAQRVKLTPGQFVKVRIGDRVEWPVDSRTSTFDGKTKQSCVLDKEFLPTEGGNPGAIFVGERAAHAGKVS
jgi:hypothetical protein